MARLTIIAVSCYIKLREVAEGDAKDYYYGCQSEMLLRLHVRSPVAQAVAKSSLQAAGSWLKSDQVTEEREEREDGTRVLSPGDFTLLADDGVVGGENAGIG